MNYLTRFEDAFVSACRCTCCLPVSLVAVGWVWSLCMGCVLPFWFDHLKRWSHFPKRAGTRKRRVNSSLIHRSRSAEEERNRKWLWSCMSHQSTVDRDSLPGPLSCGSGAFKPLRASQIYKVELGHQRLVLWLGNGTRVHTIHHLILPSSILQVRNGENQNTERQVSLKWQSFALKWQ